MRAAGIVDGRWGSGSRQCSGGHEWHRREILLLLVQELLLQELLLHLRLQYLLLHLHLLLLLLQLLKLLTLLLQMLIQVLLLHLLLLRSLPPAALFLALRAEVAEGAILAIGAPLGEEEGTRSASAKAVVA